MALLDDIQRSLAKARPQPAAAGQAQAAQAVADVAKAATGRAAPAAPVGGVGVQVAQQAAKDQAAQVAAQGAVAGAQLGAAAQAVEAEAALGQQRLDVQAQQAQAERQTQALQAGAQRAAAQTVFTAQQTAQLDAFSRELASKNQIALNRAATERGITTDQLFEEHRQGVQELAYRKDAALLEQKAHLAAMADREYVRNLTQVGTLRRLQNDLEWKSEVQRLTLGERLDALLRQQGAQSLLSANDRAFAEAMSQMDADLALAIVQQQSRDATMMAGVQSAGAAAQGIMANRPKSGETSTTSSDYSGSSNTMGGGDSVGTPKTRTSSGAAY